MLAVTAGTAVTVVAFGCDAAPQLQEPGRLVQYQPMPVLWGLTCSVVATVWCS